MNSIREIISKHFAKIVEYRRHMHENPEVSHEEVETAKYIASKLIEMGLEPKTNIGGNGVIAIIEGNGPGKCVALRADFDALPIQETTGLPFSSKVDGVSHSCGHDMHAAMLLGMAHVLLELKNEFKGCVKLIFQPAEEDVLDCGALKMIADGVLENPKVDVILGQHIWPALPSGQIAIRNGAMMASSDRFFITIKGKACHASAPEDGIDAIVIAAQIISALQSIVSRRVSPKDSAVVTVGKISGGVRYNVVAQEVKLEGTCRNLTPSVREKMAERITSIATGIAEGMGGECVVEYFRGYSPTINSPEIFPTVLEAITETVGEKSTLIPEHSALGGEDFSHYCERVASCYSWLGTRQEGVDFYPIHNGGVNPDENAMPLGIEASVRAAIKLLNA